jgi:hypothetical protein
VLRAERIAQSQKKSWVGRALLPLRPGYTKSNNSLGKLTTIDGGIVIVSFLSWPLDQTLRSQEAKWAES